MQPNFDTNATEITKLQRVLGSGVWSSRDRATFPKCGVRKNCPSQSSVARLAAIWPRLPDCPRLELAIWCLCVLPDWVPSGTRNSRVSLPDWKLLFPIGSYCSPKARLARIPDWYHIGLARLAPDCFGPARSIRHRQDVFYDSFWNAAYVFLSIFSNRGPG